MPEQKCMKCGSENLAKGAIYGPGRETFRPEGAKFLTLETGEVMTKGIMCRACGFIELVGDVNKLRRLTETGGGQQG
jgi:predicted nucleic-acid-binding Zn-ribbon protein